MSPYAIAVAKAPSTVGLLAVGVMLRAYRGITSYINPMIVGGADVFKLTMAGAALQQISSHGFRLEFNFVYWSPESVSEVRTLAQCVRQHGGVIRAVVERKSHCPLWIEVLSEAPFSDWQTIISSDFSEALPERAQLTGELPGLIETVKGAVEGRYDELAERARRIMLSPTADFPACRALIQEIVSDADTLIQRTGYVQVRRPPHDRREFPPRPGTN
jgi:hypothetical protein